MAYSLLRITDGTTNISLLETEAGFLLSDWMPSISPFKGGGVWQSSPLVDGRRLAMRNFDNGIETMDLVVSGGDQDTVIGHIQRLTEMLEKAVAYWTASWQTEPVWIEARGARETNTRYAVIKSYTLEGLNNPFSQPFFGECRSAMKELTLIVERDHWLDHEPGTEVCVPLSTTHDIVDTSAVTTVDFDELADTDDLYVEYYAGFNWWIMGTDQARNRVGYVIAVDPLWLESGLRFPNVTIDRGTIITNAYLIVEEQITGYGDDTTDCDMTIFGEKVADADPWDVNYFARRLNRTTSEGHYNSPANSWHTPGTPHTITGLASVIQEIVNQEYWVSGNALALFVTCPQTGTDYGNRWFAAYGDGLYNSPVLYIEYATTTIEVGNPATCIDRVYLANAHTRAQITHVIRWEQASNTYEDVFIDAPVNYLTFDPPTMSDRLYLGAEDSANTGPFDSATFNISFEGATDMEWTWYYYSDDANDWAALSNVEGNFNFTEDGETLVTWDRPDDWVQNTVDGVTGFWVMAEIDVAGTGAIPVNVVAGSTVYAIITPFVRINDENVPGEITALSRVRVLIHNDDATAFVAAGLRSLSRGTNFTPYLNISSKQLPLGMIGETLGWPLSVSSLAPTGECLILTDSIDYESVYYSFYRFRFDSSLAKEYRGTYHAYLRCQQTEGDAGDYSFRLKLYSADGSQPIYSSEAFTEATDIGGTHNGLHMLDLGIVGFGSNDNLISADTVSGASIEIQYTHWNETSSEVTLYDVVLIPIDEWCGIYTANIENYYSFLRQGTLLDLDATGSMRSQRAILREALSADLPISDEYLYGEWVKQARSGPLLQAKEDQRLWFLFCGHEQYFWDGTYHGIWQVDFGTKYSVRVYRNSRYLTMRGAS